MYCSKCGNEINEDSLFCPKCGVKVDTRVNNDEQSPIVKDDVGNNEITIEKTTEDKELEIKGISLDDLRDSYDDVNKCYKSDSIGKIKLLEEKLINNLVKIKNNHVIETKLLLKEVVDVRKMEKEMVKSMASLGEDN